MNAADRLFARIAINKSYVTPANVEEARTYLEKLQAAPGGAMLPLSLASILTKLGRMSHGAVATVQKEMEPFGFTCGACGHRSFHLEVGDEDPRCEPCRTKNAPLKPQKDKDKVSSGKMAAASPSGSGKLGPGAS